MFFTLLCAVLSLAGAQNNTGIYELNIIHFNDFHAHFEEVSPQGTVCNPAEAACVGGFARLYTAINEAFELEPESILLNGGDTFQGTIWYNFLRWNVSQHFMNLLPHDAHVVGNHEFDHGVEGLLPYLERLKAPMLGANVNATFEPELAKYLKNHVVIMRKGRKIGIIGVLLRVFSAPIGRVIMEDEVEAINREAAILTAQGVDIIIVLSHVGFNPDLAIAAQISSDVDIIVGAHSHTFLYTGTPPSSHNPASQYPTVVTRADGHRIPVVQASCYTRYLGNIKLFIDDNGIVQSWEGQPVYLGTSIVKDPQMEKELEPWRQEVDAVGKEVLGSSKVALNNAWCRSRECNMGGWACDGFLEALMSRASGSAWNDAQVCLVNAGGMRVQISPGNVTTESLLMAMPFENYVQVYDLPGDVLLQVLEFSVGVNFSGEFSSSRMLQVGGLRVVYNVTRPVGSRVASALVRCADCSVPRYEPMDPQKTYRVVSQNYIGDGGGGYSMISNNRKNVVNLEVDYVMLQRFMRRQGTVLQDIDGRIQIVT